MFPIHLNGHDINRGSENITIKQRWLLVQELFMWPIGQVLEWSSWEINGTNNDASWYELDEGKDENEDDEEDEDEGRLGVIWDRGRLGASPTIHQHEFIPILVIICVNKMYEEILLRFLKFCWSSHWKQGRIHGSISRVRVGRGSIVVGQGQ